VRRSSYCEPPLADRAGALEGEVPLVGQAGLEQPELPTDVPQFDTAREGGRTLRSAATAALKEKITAAATIRSTRLLSVRHEFPTEWGRFAAATVDGANRMRR
jgi:hypothetical protein